MMFMSFNLQMSSQLYYLSLLKVKSALLLFIQRFLQVFQSSFTVS